MLSDMEREDLVVDPAAAAAQLKTLQDGRAALADRAMQPWWYDALLGLLMFELIASYSVHEQWVSIAALLVFFAGNFGLMAAYKRLTGFWVNGHRPGRTQRAMRVWVVGAVVVLALAGGAEFGLGWRGAMVVAGVVLGVAVALISRWWSRIYIAELRDQA
jgi:hypothetical protein